MIILDSGEFSNFLDESLHYINKQLFPIIYQSRINKNSKTEFKKAIISIFESFFSDLPTLPLSLVLAAFSIDENCALNAEFFHDKDLIVSLQGIPTVVETARSASDCVKVLQSCKHYLGFYYQVNVIF